MHHSSGKRIRRCLLAALVVASANVSVGADREFTPIIALAARHDATKISEEPNGLVVAAEAIPLLDAPTEVGGMLSHASSNRPGPAVRLATPFDPTKQNRSQQAVARANPTKPPSVVAPVIRVYEPIKLAPLAVHAAAPGLIREQVNRSVFLSTRSDRLERGLPTSVPLIARRDQLASRLITALDSIANPKIERPKTASASLVANSFVSEPTSPLAGFIQVAEQDPVARALPSPKPSPSGDLTEAARRSRSINPILMSASRPVINPREAVAATPSEPLDIAKTMIFRPTPIVEMATNPLARRQQPASTVPAQPRKSRHEPVLQLVEAPSADIATAIAQSTAESSPSSRLNVRNQPLIQLAVQEPLLTLVQQSPSASASDLPVPATEPETSAEQIADLEEIEAIELDLKPIHAISASTKPMAGELPKNYAAARFAREGEIAHRMGYSRTQMETTMNWEAPAVCHRPLYFEDINLERHGYKFPLVQPAISAAHFFGRVPLLPYMMVNEGHRNCQYTLGHYRPGDYAPYSLYVPRLRLDASAAEVAFAAGVIFAFP